MSTPPEGTPRRESHSSHEGPLPGANAIGESGSLDSGPGIRLSLRVDVDRRILAAGYELTGFEPARAAVEELCAVLLGASLDEAARTAPAAIARLAGLTDGNAVARQIHFALRGALRPWISPGAKRGGEVVCACFALSRDEIVATIREHSVTTIEALRDRLPATRGCGTCRPDVESLLSLEREPND